MNKYPKISKQVNLLNHYSSNLETFEINCSRSSFLRFSLIMCLMQGTLWAILIVFLLYRLHTYECTHTQDTMYHISNLCSVPPPVHLITMRCVCACVSVTTCLSIHAPCVCVLGGMSHRVSVPAAVSSNFFKGESNESMSLCLICCNKI